MRLTRLVMCGLFLAGLALTGCDSDSDSQATATDSSAGVDGATGGGDTSGSDTTATPSDVPGPDGILTLVDAGPTPDTNTPQADTTQPHTGLAPAPKGFAGTCPNLAAGANSITSAGENRTFRVFLPPQPKGASLVFMWHGLGDTSQNFSAAMGAAQVANGRNAIIIAADAFQQVVAVMPPTWGFLGEPDPDLALFDDLLSCVDAQFDIDNDRVYTTGFSAGALWSTLLVMQRNEYLAAATLWSGGTSETGFVTIDYATPGHKLPVLAASGGATDTWNNLLDFQKGTDDLIAKLSADSVLVVGCNHNSGHTIPPGGQNWGWDFLFHHTYGQKSDLWGHTPSTLYPAYCKFPAAP